MNPSEQTQLALYRPETLAPEPLHKIDRTLLEITHRTRCNQIAAYGEAATGLGKHMVKGSWSLYAAVGTTAPGVKDVASELFLGCTFLETLKLKK